MNRLSPEAAERAWCEAGARILSRMVTSTLKLPAGVDVARERQLTDNSFTEFWKDRGRIDGFHKSLASYIADRERFAELPEVGTLLYDLAEAGDLANALREFCKQDFRLIMESEANAGVLALLGASRDRRMRSLLARVYRQIDDFLEEIMTSVLSARNLEVTPPLTVRQLAVMLNQLCDGLTIRARFDPSTATAELYADAVTALMLGATRRAGTGSRLTTRVEQELQ